MASIRWLDDAPTKQPESKGIRWLDNEDHLQTKQEEAKPETPKSKFTRARELNREAGEGLINLGAGALRGASRIGNTLLDIPTAVLSAVTPETAKEFKDWRYTGASQLDEENKDSTAYTIGDIGAQMAGTAGVGGLLGKGLLAVAPSATRTGSLLVSGGFGGGTPKGAAAVAADYAKRVAAGAAMGGAATALTNPEEYKTGAAVGALMPGVARPLALVAGDLVGGITGPLRESWRVAQGRKFVQQDMLGSELARQKAIKAIKSGAGSTTVADDIAAANVGKTDKFGSPLVAMQDSLETQPGGMSDIAKSLSAKQEAARMARLERVKPDLKKAMDEREGLSNIAYNNAYALDDQRIADARRVEEALRDAQHGGMELAGKAKSRIIPEIEALRGNPIIDSAAKEADILAKSMGLKIGNPMESLRGLHLMKIAIDNQFKNRTASTALQNYSDSALQSTKENLLNAIEGTTNKPGISPLYKLAREQHAEKSIPINQAEAIGEIQGAIAKQGSGQAAAVRKILAENDLAKYLNKYQLGATKKALSELDRNAERKALSAGVDTKHLFQIADKEGGAISIPSMLSRPATLTNWAMKKLGHGADDKIARDIGNLMLTNPAEFSRKYLQDIPVSHRQRVIDELTKNYLKPTGATAIPVLATQKRE